MGFLQNIQHLVSSRLAPTAPTEDGVTTLQLYCHGLENSGLPMEKIQPIMEWISASIYKSGYTGESHVFWLLPKTDQRRELLRLYRKGDMVMAYRLGDRMAPAPDGLYWRMVTEHPSTRIYQLEEQEA
jgi:hypothetical protein